MAKRKKLGPGSRLNEHLANIEAAGCTYELISATHHQYRITGPKGAKIDFWPGRERWVGISPKGPRGTALDALLALIADLEPPQKAERQASVAIFSDASFSFKTRCGGWGAWVKGDGMAAGILRGGPLKDQPRGVDEAELCAIANALAVAEAEGLLTPARFILVQSDCMAALHALRFAGLAKDRPAADGLPVAVPKRSRLMTSKCMAYIRDLVARTGIELNVRHVRGHTGGEAGRFWVNDQCDKMAKAGRRAAEKGASR